MDSPSKSGVTERGLDTPLGHLNNEELLHICFFTNQLLHDQGIHFPAPIQPSRLPGAFDNTKYEQIACAGLKPGYNESAKELIPPLNLIHLRRQNETWYPATILPLDDGTTIDIVQNLLQVPTTADEKRAKEVGVAH